MPQNVSDELINWWHWLLNQLGWSGSLNWVQIVVLILAVLGAGAVLHRLLGGGGSGGSSTVILPPDRRGLPTRAYTADPKLGDFSVPKEVYNFRMPSPAIKTSGLTGQVKLDMDKARKLFIPPASSTRQTRSSDKGPDWATAQKLFVSGIAESKRARQPVSFGNIGQPVQPVPRPDWNLARKLFVPNFEGRRK